MPFNIDLIHPTNGVFVKLQVVKKSINIYFTGNHQEALKGKWSNINDNFIATITGSDLTSSAEDVTEAHHLNTVHTNEMELETCHTHIPFRGEVTPSILSLYLNRFYREQIQDKENPQFFQDVKELKGIIKKFTIYYEEYKAECEKSGWRERVQIMQDDIAYSRILASLGRHPIYGQPVVQPAVLPTDLAENFIGSNPM